MTSGESRYRWGSPSWFVLDEKSYLSFSVEKTDARGCASKFGAWFNATFPLMADVSAGRIQFMACSFERSPLQLRFWVQQVTPRRKRVVVAGARLDVPLRTAG